MHAAPVVAPLAGAASHALLPAPPQRPRAGPAGVRASSNSVLGQRLPECREGVIGTPKSGPLSPSSIAARAGRHRGCPHHASTGRRQFWHIACRWCPPREHVVSRRRPPQPRSRQTFLWPCTCKHATGVEQARGGMEQAAVKLRGSQARGPKHLINPKMKSMSSSVATLGPCACDAQAGITTCMCSPAPL